MKTAIGLRAYGQKNPLNEYKRESFILFENLLSRVRERITQLMGHMQFQIAERRPQEMQESHPNPEQATAENVANAEKEDEAEPQTPKFEMTGGKIPRNAPCPCGSGKKYKHCCGAIKP